MVLRNISNNRRSMPLAKTLVMIHGEEATMLSIIQVIRLVLAIPIVLIMLVPRFPIKLSELVMVHGRTALIQSPFYLVTVDK